MHFIDVEPELTLQHPYMKQSATIRPDFYLKKENVYLEYWGLTEDKSYEEKRKFKLDAYKLNNIKVVELFPEHMTDYAHVLQKLLK